MKPRGSHLRSGGWLLAWVALGCTQAAALQGRIAATTDVLDRADHNGARTCAPRELAVGRSELEFSGIEIDNGHLARAQEHFDIAEPNARAALRLSPPERCLPRPPGPGDRDGDGILDNVDHCPDIPETFNGFEDADGCPDDPDWDGDGIPDSRDLCPLDPEDMDRYLDTDGCPDPDNDADGVPDGTDHCPNDAEDPDGFQDADGCPDLDNDQDTVADVDDRCPNEAGPRDNQGCPAFHHLVITQHGVRFHVEFDFDRATLRPTAAATLDEVVQFLSQAQNRTLRYEVGGHTDSVGNDRHNDRLSAQRAESVRGYLLAHGIDGARLTSHGYGERMPIDSNRTADGRQANRRVELNEIDANGQLVR